MLAALLALSLASTPAEAPRRPALSIKCSLEDQLRRPQWEIPGMVVEVVAFAPLPEDPVLEVHRSFRAWMATLLADGKAAVAWPAVCPPPVMRIQGNLLPEPAPFAWKNWP